MSQPSQTISPIVFTFHILNSKLQAWGWSVPSGSLDRNTVVKLNPSNTTKLKGQPKPIGKSEVLGHLIEISLQIAGEAKVADVTSCYEHMGLQQVSIAIPC